MRKRLGNPEWGDTLVFTHLDPWERVLFLGSRTQNHRCFRLVTGKTHIKGQDNRPSEKTLSKKYTFSAWLPAAPGLSYSALGNIFTSLLPSFMSR